MLRLLRTILTTAVEDGLIAANPCAIKGAGVEPTDERTLPTLAQVSELAATVQPQFRALVLLAAFGGMRRGELLALTRMDIDLLHRTVTVRLQRPETKGGGHLVGPPKTDAGRRTPVLPTSLTPEIEAHLDRWVAPEPDAPISRARVAVRCGWSSGSGTGRGRGARSVSRAYACTISVTSPGPWPRPPGRAPRS